MKYIVVADFYDLKDGAYHYKPGDAYPREGYEPPADRIEALSSGENAAKMPLIKAEASKPARQAKAAGKGPKKAE